MGCLQRLARRIPKRNCFDGRHPRRFVIPLLSGHAGGANELARRLGEALSAIPVITTATDINDVFSVDTFARQEHLAIVEKDEIKHLSGALLEGKPIGALTPECGFVISGKPVGQPFSHTLHLVPVVTDPRKASGALGWAVSEMLKRYQMFSDTGVRDIEGYNKFVKKHKDMEPMPKVVICIDELADLMMAAPKEVEDCNAV